MGHDLPKSFSGSFTLCLLETGKLEGQQVAHCSSPDQIRLRKVFPWRASLPYSEQSKNRITLGKFQNTLPSPPPEAPEEFSPFLTIKTWWWGCVLEMKLLRSEPLLFLTLHTGPPAIARLPLAFLATTAPASVSAPCKL